MLSVFVFFVFSLCSYGRLTHSEDKLALGHCADGHQEVLESDDLLRRDDVVANVQTLDVTLLKSICELLNIVHYNEVVADVEILQRRVLLSDHFAEFSG